MDEKEKDAVFLFDTLYTTNHIQMLKILLSYFPENSRNQLAIFIKFQEFQYTMEYVKNHTVSLSAQSTSEKKELDIASLCQALSPYCTEKERKMFDQVLQMKSNMDKYQEIMKIMPLMESMMSENTNTDSADGMGDILKNFLSEEQINMFNMFQDFGTEKTE